MKKDKMTKAELICQWKDRAKDAKHLWRGVSFEIVRILKGNSLKVAQSKLRGLARRSKAMAISGYYKSAADQVAKIRRK